MRTSHGTAAIVRPACVELGIDGGTKPGILETERAQVTLRYERRTLAPFRVAGRPPYSGSGVRSTTDGADRSAGP
ncbi:MAG TPA: hypothetical protein VK874_05595, partial [Gaiellaceae bacterium]|nr:hypothetical protein [Gaiellaceae bacterium]